MNRSYLHILGESNNENGGDLLLRSIARWSIVGSACGGSGPVDCATSGVHRNVRSVRRLRRESDATRTLMGIGVLAMTLLLQHRLVRLGVVVMAKEGYGVCIVAVQEAFMPIQTNGLRITEVEAAAVGVVALHRRRTLRREDVVRRLVKIVCIAGEGRSVDWVRAIAVGIGREGGSVIIRAKGVELSSMLRR